MHVCVHDLSMQWCNDDTETRQPSTITILPPVTHRLLYFCLVMSFQWLHECNEQMQWCLGDPELYTYTKFVAHLQTWKSLCSGTLAVNWGTLIHHVFSMMLVEFLTITVALLNTAYNLSVFGGNKSMGLSLPFPFSNVKHITWKLYSLLTWELFAIFAECDWKW